MFNPTHSPLLVALAALCQLAAAGGSARAAESVTSAQMVQTSDLDLHTEAGATALRHRVAAAARRVCGPVESIGAADYSSYASCVDQAQQQAAVRTDALIAAVRTSSRFASAAPTQ